jgi:hypothetical protein
LILIVFEFGDVEADRARAQQVVEREHVQTKLEFGELQREDFGSFEPGRGLRLPFSLSAPSVANLGMTALYIGLTAVVIVALLAVGRSFLRRKAQSVVVGPGSLNAIGSELMERSAEDLFAEADQLAGDGRLDAAVHSLLLSAIRALSEEFGPPKKSRTSRELIAHFRLEGDRRAAFSRLVAVVEGVVFGERPVDAEDYQRCRDDAVAVRGISA